MKKRVSSHARDRGGPVNLTGVHYQLLSTLQEMGAAVRVLAHDGEDGPLTRVTIVIEPQGGGDSALVQGAVRRVQQIKTHPGNWSFTQLVTRVFPDLFRAYCSDPQVARVELVTNGQLNDQAQALSGLLDVMLRQADYGESELLPWFKERKRSNATPTFADLIDYLAARLPKVPSNQDDEVVHREQVKGFLGRLSLRAGFSFEDQEHHCIEFLQGWGIAPEAIRGAIDQIVGSLLRRGRLGNQGITFSELALELGLAQRDLSSWRFIVGLSRDRLLADLARPRPGYQEGQDIRSSDPLTLELLHLIAPLEADQSSASLGSRVRSNSQLQPVVLWGKSGIGKTWLLARAAFKLAQTEWSVNVHAPALLWISSKQDPRSDLESAAQKFCHRLWGRDQAIPLELLADRVNQAAGSLPAPWLVVFIDGVQSVQSYLDRLGEVLHSELGVLLVIAVTVQRSDDSPESRGLRLLQAPGFNQDEVLSFLERHLTNSSRLPPPDVRRLLETPIFCAIYAALKQDGTGWQLEDEYGLVQRFWLERLARPRPQAADNLARLSWARMRDALATNDRPSGANLGWAVSELTEADLSQEDLDVLEGAAILVRDSWSRSYSFGHDRILQWAAAEGTLRALQARRVHPEELAQLCAAILTGENQARWMFGYVPADLLWLLLDPDLPDSCRSAAETILAELERHHSFLRLEDWLTTLGQRLIPVLFARLRSAEPEHVATLYTYRNALNKIPGVDVGHLATRLLAEPSLELQEIGVLLLGEREQPSALDALWVLYKDWWIAAHPPEPPNPGRREGPWMYHVQIGEKALRRSVRNQPEWLERKLLDSESLEGADSTLLFLLASTPKGEAVWKRHKELLRSRLPANRQRGFVRCIISFHDREEIPWLESRANEPRDLVAPSARGALALLDPERALVQVDPEALLDLALARGWWLPLARIQRPRETSSFLKELILSSEDPIKTVFSFSGFELWYSSEVIAFLLDTVQGALTAMRQGAVESGKDPLYAPLLRLSDCNTLEQLELFWEASRTRLEADLADWLSKRGPNDERWTRHGSEEEAGKVLKLMTGSGAAKAGRSFLEKAVTWTGGRDGLDLAVREPDAEVRKTIRRKALDPTPSAAPMSTEHPILQRLCVSALAYLRDFEGFARGVIQWGLELQPDIAKYLDDHWGEPELLEVAKTAMEQGPTSVGVLLLLGIHGGPEAVAILQEESLEHSGTTDLELARIIGLDYSKDCSSVTLAAFEDGLASEDNRISFSSWRAILHRIEQPAAQQLLLSMVGQSNSDSAQRAALLLENEILRRPLAELLWSRREESFFIFYFGSQLEYFAILGTEEVKTFLLDQATGAINPMAPAARYSAIRGLASFDRSLALRAALACGGEVRSSKDRDWSALMLEVGGVEALPYLKVLVAEDRDIARLQAFGEVLRAAKQNQILAEWLQDTDPRVREGACYAACAQAYETQLEQIVIRCCLDPEEDVRTAAQAAFELLWRDREVSRLIDRLRSEAFPGRRWALIDAALAIGYPGVRSGFGQISWFSELARGRAYYEVQYAVDRLKERRKKLIEELDRKSKEFRKDA